jgi:hypothetical protein
MTRGSRNLTLPLAVSDGLTAVNRRHLAQIPVKSLEVWRNITIAPDHGKLSRDFSFRVVRYSST